MITIKVDPVKVVQAAYRYSRPQGMGFLHFREGELAIEDAKKCIRGGSINMDYVYGRACKFYATISGAGVKFHDDGWFDHTKGDLEALLEDLKAAEAAEAAEAQS